VVAEVPGAGKDSPGKAEALEVAYGRRRDLVVRGLEAVLPPAGVEPRRLHEAMRHAVFGGDGGKRLRPVLLLTLASDLGIAEERALPAALALELVHCYSLVHDDLPCMDDAATRRGVPSVHAAFGYAEAVLAGDALLTLAFEVLGRAGNSGLRRPGELVVELARASGSLGMVGGQQVDLDRSGAAASSLPGDGHPVLRLHGLKTAALFGFAFVAPGHLADLPAPAISSLRVAGQAFGTAFQVADDLRDESEDASQNFARAVGPDEARRVAHEAIAKCLENLRAVVGEAETSALVRAATRAMGLDG